MVSDYDHEGRCLAPVVVSYTIGQYLDIALTTVQYGIYCPGGSFDLPHRFDITAAVVVGREYG